jgi:hypothetical protein
MGQIHPSEAATRLQLDMARDAGLEAFRRLARQVKRFRARLGRAREKRRDAQEQLRGVLHDLAAGPVALPRPAGAAPVPQDQVLAAFHRLATDDFPALAGALHEAVGRVSAVSYQCFLVEEVLAKGSYILIERLLRHAARGRSATDEGHYLDELRHHLAGKVNRALGRQSGYQVTPEVGGQLDTLLRHSLTFLGDLLASEPPGRLLLPLSGAPFDPERHEPIPGRPATGELVVRATAFPGYAVFEDPPRLVVKARVYTRRAGAAARPGPPPLPDEAG